MIRWRFTLQEFCRNRRCHGFLRWMRRRHGPADCAGGERSWRVNGVLCTVWMSHMRLKVYWIYPKPPGSLKTAPFSYWDLTDKEQAKSARAVIKNLEKFKSWKKSKT